MGRDYLIGREELERLYIILGHKEFNRELVLTGGRRTGRTTTRALEIIARAMKNPGNLIPIVDHYSFRDSEADYMLARVIENIIQSLKLKGFSIKHIPEPSIIFNLYEISPKEFLKEKQKLEESK